MANSSINSKSRLKFYRACFIATKHSVSSFRVSNVFASNRLCGSGGSVSSVLFNRSGPISLEG